MTSFVISLPCVLRDSSTFTPNNSVSSVKGNLVCSTFRRTLTMTLPHNQDQPDPSDTNPFEATQTLDDADYIVDVEDDDLGASVDGLDVIDVDTDVDVQKRKPPRLRKNLRPLIEEIDFQRDNYFASDADTQPPMEEDETAVFVRTAVKAANERKAEDIVALRISKLTYIASFVVIATGNNAPQIRAIANLVEEDLGKKHGLSPRRVDGVPNSGWVLLDYGDLLVNIFSPAQRQNYNLEGLWAKAEDMDISDYITGNTPDIEPSLDDNSLDDWLGE